MARLLRCALGGCLLIAACKAFGSASSGVDGGGATDVATDGALVTDAVACSGGSSDPKNCGRCGHDCLGGECASGTCRPFELTKIELPSYLAVDERYVFVTSENGGVGLTRVDKDGGARALLSQRNASGLTLDSAAVYFCDLEANRLYRIEKTGTDLVPLSSTRCTGCAERDGSVYATEYDANRVMRYGADGGPGTLLAYQDGGNPEGVAVDETHLFFAWHSRGEVASIPRTGGKKLLSLDFGARPRRIAIDDSRVYWIDYATNEIHRVGKDKRDARVLWAGPQGLNVGGIAVDATHVYWAVAFETGGSIMRAPKGGGAAEVLAPDLEKPVDVVLDGDAIYFTVMGAGSLMRLAKP